MKRKTYILGCAGILAAMFIGHSQVLAEEQTTTGEVTFNEGTSGDSYTVLPGSAEDRIIPDDGKTGGKDALRINWVPNFKFGTVDLSVASQSYPAYLSTYTDVADEIDPNGSAPTPIKKGIKIPQFVQVADTRGLTNGTFKLTAQATKFSDGTKELANTRIQFYHYKVFNNLLDQKSPNSDASSILDGLVSDAGISTGAMAELKPTETTQILQTKNTGISSPTASSLVFSDDYTSTKDYSKETYNKSVKLFVPAGEGAKKNVKYTSTITWTLGANL